MHALTEADASLALHLDLKDRLSAAFVFDDGHVPELEAARLIGPEARIGGKQHIEVLRTRGGACLAVWSVGDPFPDR